MNSGPSPSTSVSSCASWASGTCACSSSSSASSSRCPPRGFQSLLLPPRHHRRHETRFQKRVLGRSQRGNWERSRWGNHRRVEGDIVGEGWEWEWERGFGFGVAEGWGQWWIWRVVVVMVFEAVSEGLKPWERNEVAQSGRSVTKHNQRQEDRNKTTGCSVWLVVFG